MFLNFYIKFVVFTDFFFLQSCRYYLWCWKIWSLLLYQINYLIIWSVGCSFKVSLCGFQFCWWLDLVQDIQFTVTSIGLHHQYAWECECSTCNCNRVKCWDYWKLENKNMSIYYVFFLVFPRRLIVVCRRFGTLYQFHLQGLDVKYEKWAEDVVFIYQGWG